MAKTTGSIVLFMILGAIFGGYIGELAGLLIPTGFFHDLLTKSFDTGLDSMVLNLKIIVLTFGFKIYINLCSIAGMIVGFYYSR